MTVLLATVLAFALLGMTINYLILARRVNRLTDEVTELQAVADANLLEHGLPPVFMPRYDLEYVIDPEAVPAPADHPEARTPPPDPAGGTPS